jgi:hypothetical protein
MFGVAPLKMISFLCFQISQAQRIMRVLTPFSPLLFRPSLRPTPPIREDQIVQGWSNSGQTNLCKHRGPYLSCKDTVGDEVLLC